MNNFAASGVKFSLPWKEKTLMTRTAPLLCLIACFSPMLHAAPISYDVASDRTSIDLSWWGFGHAFSQAHLHGVTGTLTLNPDEDPDDRIEVTIPVGTLVSSNTLLT